MLSKEDINKLAKSVLKKSPNCKKYSSYDDKDNIIFRIELVNGEWKETTDDYEDTRFKNKEIIDNYWEESRYEENNSVNKE